ncbi:hypothetical protein Tsubulata_016601 [Turnera subulata]|uniref:BED-type domain-containing protein n=1 Tax=Turnera subulata TaxID=218843 RepID=A0A9Q0G5T4_9ROSI|nr:hypothetical protein Tsubulata_016601 [Turnera subulata]
MLYKRPPCNLLLVKNLLLLQHLLLVWPSADDAQAADAGAGVYREQLEEHQSDWAYSKPVVILESIWNLVFVGFTASVVVLSRREDPNVPLRLWIRGYELQCLMLIWCVAAVVEKEEGVELVEHLLQLRLGSGRRDLTALDGDGGLLGPLTALLVMSIMPTQPASMLNDASNPADSPMEESANFYTPVEIDGSHSPVEVNSYRPREIITGSVPKSNGKTRSVVWNYFTKKEVNGEVKAECNNCKMLLVGKSTNGTSGLHGHYRRCLKRGAPTKLPPPTQAVEMNASPLESEGQAVTILSVWNHFMKKNLNGEVKAECNSCKMLLGAKSANGTSGLHAHFKRCQMRKPTKSRQKLMTNYFTKWQGKFWQVDIQALMVMLGILMAALHGENIEILCTLSIGC